jgi:hypothetical protein
MLIRNFFDKFDAIGSSSNAYRLGESEIVESTSVDISRSPSMQYGVNAANPSTVFPDFSKALKVQPPDVATARTIADAWLSQSQGYESYFFNNVQHGIRTADDLEIWRRIEDRLPRWIKSEAYREAIEILRAECDGAQRSA